MTLSCLKNCALKHLSHAKTENLAGYSPWGHIELDTTERLTLSLSRTVPHLHEESRGLCKMNTHSQESVMRDKGVRILISSPCVVSKSVIDWENRFEV